MAIDPFNKKQLNYRSYINTVRSLYDRPATQTSTALILTLITIAFFGLAAIRPTFTTISKLEAELKEKRLIEADMQSKLSAIAKVQEQYFNNQELVQVFNRAIPNDQNLEDILTKLEFIATQNQANLRNIQVFDTQTYGLRPKTQTNTSSTTDATEVPYEFFEVTFSVEGSYDDLISFLERINNLDRYAQINSITFNQPTEEDATYELNMGVKLTVFWNQAQPINAREAS